MMGECKKIYLCRPDDSIVTVLNSVRTDTVSYSKHLKDYQTLSFDIDRYMIECGEEIPANGYDDLGVYMHLLLEGVGYFEMQEPELHNDGISEYKSIVAYSVDKEFESRDFIGFQINTGKDGSLERLDPENLDELKLPKKYIEFYRPNDSGLTQYSLIHIILEKMPGWTVRDEDIDPLLWSKKMNFDESGSINLYALLNSTIAPKYECIFDFDILNRRIKAIAKDRLDDYYYDSNIFISYRNLANAIDITTNEDSVYTRFNCQGEESLTFSEYNYNDSRIIDLSYFMNEKYMDAELIEKLTYYNNWRDDHRQEFLEICRNQMNAESQIYNINYRVPDDSTEWNQWANMEEDALRQNLDYYNALLMKLQSSVDENPQYDSEGNYIPRRNADGEIDHDFYLPLLDKQTNGYGGYYTYRQILEYVIPEIQMAIDNLLLPEDQKKKPVDELVTMWELYGIKELEAKKETYESQLESLAKYEKPWDELTDEEKQAHSNQEDNYNIYRNQYFKKREYLDGILAQLEIERVKLAEVEAARDEYTSQRQEMYEQAQMEHEQFGFTADDLIVINTLLHDTDYSNSNIFTTTSVGMIEDINANKLEKEIELYNDSLDKLSEVSQPQYTASVNLENLMRLPEFAEWREDCTLLRFIRLGIREDYVVKLRIVGISWNPCDITPDLTLEFSNMITSRSGRSDLTDVLQTESRRAAKNSISVSAGDIRNDSELLSTITNMLIKSSAFGNSVSGMVSNAMGGVDLSGIGINVSDDRIQSIVADYMKVAKIDVGQITGETAQFEELFAKYIDADFIATKVLEADEGNFNTLATKILEAGEISADKIESAILNANAAQIENIYGKIITSEKITTTLLQADKAVFKELATEILSISTLNADVANIQNLLAGNAGVGNLQSIHLTADNITIDDAVIKNIIAAKISVADLMAHSATADRITIISNDGNPAIAFQNATQQFYDSAGNVRVQIGQDGNGDFNFVVRGEDGTTALFDQDGIKREAIPDNTIVGDMINNSTISKDKLSFEIIEPNAQGGIDISKVYTGEGGVFGVEYTTFKESVTGTLETVTADVETITANYEEVTEQIDKTAYTLQIHSTLGLVLDVRSAQTTLCAKLYKYGEEVTDQYEDSCFVWKRTSGDPTDDEYWNDQHSDSGKELTVTRSDVCTGASFRCSFIINGNVIAQSN